MVAAVGKPFEAVKEGTSRLDFIPPVEPESVPVIDAVELDDTHRKLITHLAERGAGEWQAADKRLNTHTHALRLAHEALGLRGTFETLATGSGGTSNRNCFAYPKPRGS